MKTRSKFSPAEAFEWWCTTGQYPPGSDTEQRAMVDLMIQQVRSEAMPLTQIESELLEVLPAAEETAPEVVACAALEVLATPTKLVVKKKRGKEMVTV